MTKKQKKTRNRIIIVLILFVILFAAEHLGIFESWPRLVVFVIFFIPYLIIGYDVILHAFKNISHGNVFDENFLMMVATFAAFGLGLFGEGEYPEALAVMLFYQIGELFQSYAVGKSRQSITEMMSIAPDFAYVERDGEIEEVDPEEAHIGDILVIRPGEKIPLDGIVVEGDSFLDTAALTGESVPRSIHVGDEIISGCINKDSLLKIRATKEYEDSTVAKILDLVENASAKKARLENFITRFARYYTPVVTVGAVLLAFLLPLFTGVGIAEGIRRACNFLIVSCPCALVISVPLGFFGGIGAASKIGVLVKGSNFLEAAASLDVMVMDKTGTLTKGEFRVQEILPADGANADEILEMAAHAESYSTHPIALSVLDAYQNKPDLERIVDTNEIAGHGVKTVFDGKVLLVGNGRLMESEGISYTACTKVGTILYVAYDHVFKGSIVIADTVKEGAAQAISEMKENGISRTIMLTGDRRNAAEAVAEELGVSEVKSELLPADKVSAVESLMSELEKAGGKDKLGFVGDGINDAPVLMRADVGFAMGSLGSDAAIEAADIVIMDDDIRKIPAVIRIARKTMKTVKSNIAFAISVKVLILALSAIGLAGMWAAVFADVGVAVLCIINSMRVLESR